MADSSATSESLSAGASDLNAKRSGYGMALLSRGAQGVAFGALAITSARSDSNTLPPGLIMAAALCGCGVGISFDRWFSRAFGRLAATRISLLLVLFASGLACVTTSSAAVLASSAFIGFGLQTEWGSLSEIARGLTSTTDRWHRMRLFHLSFFVGFTIACIAGSFSVQWQAAVVLLSISAVMSLFMSAEPCDTSEPDETSQQITGPEPEQIAAIETEKVTSHDAAEENDCDAVECCGGSSREIVPTPPWLGYALGATSGLLLFGLLAELISASPAGLLVAVGFSCVVGHLLVTTSSPQTGYVVTVIGFSCAAAVIVGFHLATDASSALYLPTLFAAAFFVTGVTSGLNAMLGELFSDCGSEGKRTAVLSNSAFAASAVMVVVSLLPRNDIPFVNGFWVLIFPVILAFIRLIPTPVISHLGRDEVDPEDEAERQEIVAAMRQ